jgi:hypothetical protein
MAIASAIAFLALAVRVRPDLDAADGILSGLCRYKDDYSKSGVPGERGRRGMSILTEVHEDLYATVIRTATMDLGKIAGDVLNSQI